METNKAALDSAYSLLAAMQQFLELSPSVGLVEIRVQRVANWQSKLAEIVELLESPNGAT